MSGFITSSQLSVSSADFLFALPREMRYLDGFTWDWAADHMAIDLEEARVLGYESGLGSSDSQETDEDERATEAFPATPPDQIIPSSPMLTHSSTLKPNTPPSKSLPASNSLSKGLELVPWLAESMVSPRILAASHDFPDEWINSQSSVIDRETSGSRTPSRKGRTPSMSTTDAAGGSNDTALPCLAPDSAGTTTSSLPPLTPPSSHSENGSCHGELLLPPQFKSPSQAECRSSKASTRISPILNTVRLVDSHSSDIDVAPSEPPTILESVVKVVIPVASLCHPMDAKTPTRALLYPDNEPRLASDACSDIILVTPSAEPDSAAAHEPGPVSRSAIKQRALGRGSALSILASASAKLTQLASFHSSDGGSEQEAVGDGMDTQICVELEDKRWFMDHVESDAIRPSSRSAGEDALVPTSYPTSATGEVSSAIIDPSEIPGLRHSSPALGSSTDETTESETTPLITSRSKRRKAREARRLEKLGVKLAATRTVEMEEQPLPESRNGIILTSRMKQRLIDGDMDGMDIAPPSLIRGLIEFASQASSSGSESGGSAAPGTLRVSTERLASIEEEGIFNSGALPCSPDVPRTRGKTIPGMTSRGLPRSVPHFVAPAHVNDVKGDQENQRIARRKRGDGGSIGSDKQQLRTPSLERLPLASIEAHQEFTSISETAKLRRSRTNISAAATTTEQTSADPAIIQKRKPRSVTVVLTTPSSSSKSANTRAGQIDTDHPSASGPLPDDDDGEYQPGAGDSGQKRKKQKRDRAPVEESPKQRRGYSREEKDILLNCWNGEDPLGNDLLAAASDALVDAGFARRNGTAIKWYLKNTMFPEFVQHYRLYPSGSTFSSRRTARARQSTGQT